MSGTRQIGILAATATSCARARSLNTHNVPERFKVARICFESMVGAIALHGPDG
jgi:hypothetical protein